MAHSYDLYFSPKIDTSVAEMLRDHKFTIKTKPRKIADGQQGIDYTVTNGKSSMAILESFHSLNRNSRYLLCLAKPKDRNFLMEVVEIFKFHGATANLVESETESGGRELTD